MIIFISTNTGAQIPFLWKKKQKRERKQRNKQIKYIPRQELTSNQFCVSLVDERCQKRIYQY